MIRICQNVVVVFLFAIVLSSCNTKQEHKQHEANTKENKIRPGAIWQDNNGVAINAHGGGMLFPYQPNS